ncbi:multifunctional oxoglutarate decarboxylase/oxoglutarate dehydrogenase thiamine pyrophosphate-binding subunit/dihydrolipoyllysine-residue succinyltransferase subunit [Arcanobacterium ihumii]|uniref:multifunctional oxoglutarate decarboxylase/oxoglutarate dehydrogenase thiamine pyrophosphate-binding subunit/dihydrolipoyllysine-residue succinyltransferase subunit n=1 Tax=Arcanobacterium ihumii TaxID=2138162 RepID=UPI000F52D25F|nr:multifunctional oxoglutarate decarboxylase/oxoglutarate dehydrogenase thiamine pyrophosphate-binding subunit/dihydrolipoyllysine-residue succinyltransferase subunit [Arcanobacterium ihumii]
MSQGSEEFGPNQGFIEDLYAAYLKDRSSVGPQWLDMFRRWENEGRPTQKAEHPQDSTLEGISQHHRGLQEADRETTQSTNVTRSDLPPQPRSAAQPALTPYVKSYDVRPRVEESTPDEDEFITMKGADRGLAKNMDASLSIPTATSVRSLPARIMFDNRMVINKYLSTTRGGKVSFTHLIAYSMVEALAEMPEMNNSYKLDEKGKPTLVKPAHINFGLAIDVVKPDGSRTLVVPNIKQAEALTFSQFFNAYEDLVERGRNNKLTLDDYQGTTVSLTNPGGLGTVHSIPRLMNGQGLIVGVGSMTYPPEFQGTADEALARMGVSKVVHLTSTYDHRVIQGATSGRFLRLLEQKLLGLDGFYDRVYMSLRVPYRPFRWEKDVEYDAERELGKPARIAELIHAYRSRGHLIADTDPLSFHIRRHPDLELRSYGLTLWDLDRSFPTGGFAGTSHLTLREILDQLREAYCRTVGIEYMHIQDPAQRRWFQERLERPADPTPKDTQLQILKKLNEAEAFETFLQTKYVGQKRFSLEGGESLIPALDAILDGAAEDGLSEVAIGMAHRGRLNVLTNIAGKSYKQIFTEFDGLIDPNSVQGSGDVKYHLGTEGMYTSPSGDTVGVYLAANPSHLEAADGVLEGVVRAKIDHMDAGEDAYGVLPILIHGDSAFAGQGVVTEVLNYSQLPAYRTGGTIHVIVNNQIGFTTAPSSARSSRYATDITKGLQLPIFHVNGDDPEAVVRMARMAYEYREEFKKDVLLDITCYRKRGHNEGDDPSMTQPIMYSLVDSKRSTRQLYTEALLGRGELSEEQLATVEQDFQATLDGAFAEVRDAENTAKEAGKSAAEILGLPNPGAEEDTTLVGWETAISPAVLARIGDVHTTPPEGFSLHRKIEQLFDRRNKMAREGGIDWGFGELIAFGSLLIDGVPVRISGQDSRRGTFVQRHAVAHCNATGAEWTPLEGLTDSQAHLAIYDSSLSEYSVLAFEYGYSVERPDALVLWEAQFGDFANGAQTVIDEFISSAEQKWNQKSSLVMLLPHGYEGQGPDHSSARIERYLQLCAEDNMLVVQPSTPANHFHLLRRQAFARPRKPLIAFTPKQLLRRKGVVSSVEDFTQGRFQPVIGETNSEIKDVDRVLLCTGRLYYDLLDERAKRGDTSTAIVRVEQLYPNPVEDLSAELARYPGAELLWVQDEPANQGAWSHLALEMFPTMGISVRRISRPHAAAPSTGLAAIHKSQNAQILASAFDR